MPSFQQTNSQQIYCPIDLDSLILSKDCTPQYIETNLCVNDDILYDAIRTSINAQWLLKLDVLSEFTKEFRSRIFNQLKLNAFGLWQTVYFKHQINTVVDSTIRDELSGIFDDNTLDSAIHLFNPLNMLGNTTKEYDFKVISGNYSLSDMIYERIRILLKTKNKSIVDFSHSIFLPEILTPKFFSNLNEAGKLVILTNINKYFQMVNKFVRTGFRNCRKGDFNAPLCLIKHVLSDEIPYTLRLKISAWSGLLKEMETTHHQVKNAMSTFRKFFDIDKVMEHERQVTSPMLQKQNITEVDLCKMAADAGGVFESFELGCTLHNLEASDFLLNILADMAYFKMAEGLMEFQDEDTKLRLFKLISKLLKTNLV